MRTEWCSGGAAVLWSDARVRGTGGDGSMGRGWGLGMTCM